MKVIINSKMMNLLELNINVELLPRKDELFSYTYKSFGTLSNIQGRVTDIMWIFNETENPYVTLFLKELELRRDGFPVTFNEYLYPVTNEK